MFFFFANLLLLRKYAALGYSMGIIPKLNWCSTRPMSVFLTISIIAVFTRKKIKNYDFFGELFKFAENLKISKAELKETLLFPV